MTLLSRSVILVEVICTTIRPGFGVPLIYFFYLHTIIWQKYMVLFHLSFLLYTTIRPRNYGPHWFISFICTQRFDRNIWPSFIYPFFYARPFDQKLRSTLIYFFYLNMTFDKNICSSFISSFFCARPFDQKLGSSLIYLFYLYMIIPPKFRILINLFLL